MNNKDKLAMLGAALAGGSYVKSQFDDEGKPTPSEIIQNAINIPDPLPPIDPNVVIGGTPEYDNNDPFVANPHTGGIDGLCVRMGFEPGTAEAFEFLKNFAKPYQLTAEEIEGNAYYAQLEAKYAGDHDDVPISAHEMSKLEDMHLDALQKAEDAAADGHYSTAYMLRQNAADIDHIMHGNNGNW